MSKTAVTETAVIAAPDGHAWNCQYRFHAGVCDCKEWLCRSFDHGNIRVREMSLRSAERVAIKTFPEDARIKSIVLQEGS